MSTPGQNYRSASMYRTATLTAFILGVALLGGYFYAQAGGYMPGFSKLRNYKVSFDVPSVANVVPFSDVLTAGVQVGKVDSIDREHNNSLRVTLALDEEVTPIREGTTVQLTEKLLTGNYGVRLEPGTGAPLPDGAVLPASAVKPTVQLRDVLASLDAPTRMGLGGMVRSLSQGTDGRQKDLSGIAAGLAAIGGNGGTVLDALSDQSTDLQQASRELTQVFDAFDAGQGQIAQLVTSLDKVTAATAGQRPALEASMRKLPGVLNKATSASEDISRLSHALGPVAADFRQAAPDLNTALVDLPDATHDLRGALGPLHAVLDHAEPTLQRLPDFGEDTRDFVPPTISVLRDANPMLRYIRPYGHEAAAFVTNFGSMIGHYGDDGQAYARLKPYGEGRTPRPNPVKLPGSLYPSNPYPRPGDYPLSKPFTGKFPRIERDN